LMKRLAIVLAGWSLLAGAASAQTDVLLNQLSGVRGMKVQGQPGLTGPPTAPMAGDLGRSSALVDLNGDGLADLVVGAPLLPTAPGTGVLDDAGHTYILFGSPDKGTPGSSPDFSFASFNQGEAVDLVGDPGDRAGSSVAAV